MADTKGELKIQEIIADPLSEELKERERVKLGCIHVQKSFNSQIVQVTIVLFLLCSNYTKQVLLGPRYDIIRHLFGLTVTSNWLTRLAKKTKINGEILSLKGSGNLLLRCGHSQVYS